MDIGWSKEGGELPPVRTVDDRRGTLTITNAHESDSGIYICTANDRYSIETARAELIVGGGMLLNKNVLYLTQYSNKVLFISFWLTLNIFKNTGHLIADFIFK